MNEQAADGREDTTAPGGQDTGTESAASGDPAAQVNVDEIGRLRDELAEANDRLLRMAAELDNVRKRSQREVENAHRFGIERFAQALLPVVDSFQAALNAENLELATLLEGQRATLRLLEQAFRDADIEQIDPVGEPFDPQLHEAISMLVSPTAAPDSVIDVIQKGYTLQSRLLRPARVIVARAPE